MKIGFIGFGGAAYGLAKGLRQEGLTGMYYFDSLWETPPDSDVIRRHAKETGTIFKKSIKELIEEVEIVISCVTGSVALSVARQASSYLEKHHLFVDVNTTSPETMEAAGNIIKESGADFTDVAMLGGIPAFLHRVPSIASGSGAERFKTAMDPYGMDITYVGEIPGQASAIKMFRSVFMKGFLALLIEMLNGTHRYGVDSLVLDSIAKTMENKAFLETVRMQMAKGVINAERMSHEMAEVIETYTEMGLSSVMSSATMEKLKWCSQMELVDHFGGDMPESLNEILDVMDERTR